MAKKKKLIDIPQCIYNHDPEDEGCANCNGIVIELEDGSEVSAEECGGYTAPEVIKNDVAVTPPQEVQSDLAAPSESNATSVSNTNVPVGITTEIKCESGVSVEVKGIWYKLSYSETRNVPENCNLEVEKADLWNSVNNEVDGQVESILDK